MRIITNHLVPGDSTNYQLQIEVVDEPDQGEANHKYRVMLPPPVHQQESSQERNCFDIDFQNGPIKEFGVNGVTHEALLAIVLDRLISFQQGPYASPFNQAAHDHVEAALTQLKQRTRERLARGVEGTNAK